MKQLHLLQPLVPKRKSKKVKAKKRKVRKKVRKRKVRKARKERKVEITKILSVNLKLLRLENPLNLTVKTRIKMKMMNLRTKKNKKKI